MSTARAQPDTPHAGLHTGYAPPEGFYDEMLEGTGQIRDLWKPFLRGLEGLGAEQLEQREERLSRIIREHGVTYNVYSDKQGTHRHWTMDVVPLVIAGQEWERLEQALSQRLHLINKILQDFYGPQRLLKGRHFPAALVHGNPAFLRPCHGLIPPTQRHIHVYAADLARSPDGSWWVLNDRLDAASGLGYAIENRFISTRVLPDLFQRFGVHRLPPFLSRFVESLERLAPRPKENPNVVFLTPGPANETYFEHAFLARNLGYPLVQGSDLTVRNNTVYLKTISGRQQVDVIIRRVDSEWLDPLELRSESLLGVPGLLNALRQGNVALANAPGARLLETSALPAFFPAIARNLLGEELLIPSVATWWCGQPRELAYVLEHLETLVLYPTFPSSLGHTVVGSELTQAERAAWRDRIRHRPERYCAREMVAQSTTPVFTDRQLSPRHFLLRVYMVPSRGQYVLMPGGLARIAPTSHSLTVSMQQGGESKDTWVLLPERGTRENGATVGSNTVLHLRRSSENLSSRLADNLFWLGRYLERAEALSRLLRTLIDALLEETGPRYRLGSLPLFSTLLDDEATLALIAEHELDLDTPGCCETLARFIWGADEASSLVVTHRHLQRITDTLKERLSVDITFTLRQLSRAEQAIPRDSAAVLDDATRSYLDSSINALGAFSGLISENMTRGHGWIFLDLGRRIERALYLANLLYSSLVEASWEPESTLQKLLVATDSLMTYRRRYLTNLQPEAALDLLVLDETNPRSLAYQAEGILRDLRRLPHAAGPEKPRDDVARRALYLYSLVGLADARQLAEAEDKRRNALAAFLDDFAGAAMDLSDLVARRYFAIMESQTARPDSRFATPEPLST